MGGCGERLGKVLPMSELINELLTPELKLALMFLVAFFVMLYVLSVVYVARDARRRGSSVWVVWALATLVLPGIGLVAYLIMRPSTYTVDREEQALDIALREHQLSKYGVCPNCGEQIDEDFIVCPMCDTQVRNVCPSCHRPLNANWKVCPYCRTHIH